MQGTTTTHMWGWGLLGFLMLIWPTSVLSHTERAAHTPGAVHATSSMLLEVLLGLCLGRAKQLVFNMIEMTIMACLYIHTHMSMSHSMDHKASAALVQPQHWKMCCAVRAGVWPPPQHVHQAASPGLLIIYGAGMAACIFLHVLCNVAQHIKPFFVQ